jgi:hypothetical protein
MTVRRADFNFFSGEEFRLGQPGWLGSAVFFAAVTFPTYWTTWVRNGRADMPRNKLQPFGGRALGFGQIEVQKRKASGLASKGQKAC